jgi:hypothetical protein
MKRLWLVVVVIALGCSKKAAPVDLGTVLHPFGAVAKVWFGMKPAELEAVAPLLKANEDSSWYSAHPDGADYTVQLDGGHVVEISIQLFHRSPNDLWKAWGPGTVYAPPPEEHRRYFDAALGARADVDVFGDGFAIHLVPMTSLATLLGSDPTSIDGVKVIGRPLGQVIDSFTAHGRVAKREPSESIDAADVKLPATEWTSSIGSISLSADSDGIVNDWALMLPIDAYVHGRASPTATAAVLAIYEHLWGKPSEDGSGNLTYPTTPSVHVDRNVVMATVRLSLPPASPPPPPAPPKKH